MQPQFQSDLDWQAFAYWSDELSPSERARFEARLADDQEAREALARAVELSYAVAAVESLSVTPAERQPNRRSRRLVAWSVGFAASALALLLGLAIGQRPGGWSGHKGSATLQSSNINPDLASAWSEIRQSWDDLTTLQPLPTVDQSVDADAGNEPETATDWDSGEWEPPSWMAAALLGQSTDSGPTMDDLPDNDSLPGETSKES